MILTGILSVTMSAASSAALVPSSLLAMQAVPARPAAPTTAAPSKQPTRTTVTVNPTGGTAPAPLAPYREIWGLSWRSVPAGCNLLTQMIRFEGQFHPGFRTTSLASLPNPATVAAQTNAMPAGRAAIQWWRYSNSLFYPDSPNGAPAVTATSFPVPWDTNAVTAVSTEWGQWLQQFKNAGGKLDLLIGDCERWGMFTSWGLSAAQVQRIASDPRANQPFYTAPALTKLLNGVNVNAVKSFTQTTDYMKWDCAMGTMTAAVMKKAVWDPAVLLYPNLKGSNYGGVVMTSKPAPDLNGHPNPCNNIVGTAASPVAYGEIGCVATAWFIDPTDPTQLSKSGTKRLERTPWTSFLLDVQRARACKRNAPNVPLQPWISFQAWRGLSAGPVPYPNDLRYYDEMIRHYALHGTEVFLYWNPDSAGAGPDINWSEVDRNAGAFRLNGILADLNTRLDGVVYAAATTDAIRFDSSVVTSGARRRDGKWIWRTTVRPEVRRLRNVTTNALVDLDTTGVGRWDVGDTATPPQYVADSAPASLVIGSEPRVP